MNDVLRELERTLRSEKPIRIPKQDRPLCGATCRDGHACQARAVPGKKRCRMHGGLSTGAKTEAGRAVIQAVTLRRIRRDRAEQRVRRFEEALLSLTSGRFPK